MRKNGWLLLPLWFTVIACSLPFLTGSSGSTPAPLSPSDTPIPPTATVATPVEPAPTHTESPPEPLALFIEKQIVEENPDPWFVIEVRYPYLEGVPRAVVFNQAIEEFINRDVEQFKIDAEQLQGEWRHVQSFLSIQYDVTYQSNELFSTLFNISYLTAGAAHPGANVHSENYDLARGRFIELPSLFIPNTDFLQIIAAYCTDELDNQGLLAWPEGVEPILTNFETWNIQPEHLLITFPPYQVAPGAAGVLQVEIPLDHLSEVISPEGGLAPLLE